MFGYFATEGLPIGASELQGLSVASIPDWVWPIGASVAFASFVYWVEYLLTFLICVPYLIVTPLWVFTTSTVFISRVYDRIRGYIIGQPVSSGRLTKDVWTIHGRRYDLTSFMSSHPGGSWALQLGRNRDCTGLFESYHVMSDMSKLEKMLARYELPESKSQPIDTLRKPEDNPTGLVFRDEFHEDVKKMARDYFKEKGISHKMKPWVFCLILSAIGLELVFAALLLNGYKIGLIMMPVICCFLTFNVSHEASHFSMSKSPIVNSAFTFTSAPLIYNSTAWYIQHVVQHHVYTNDEDDVDLYHFEPLVRTTRLSQYFSRYSMQWASVWLALPTTVLHLSFVVPFDLLSGQKDMITGKRRYEQCDNVEDLVAASKKWIIAEFCVSAVCQLSMLYFLGPFQGFVGWCIMSTIGSLIFIVFTQGAHLQEEAQPISKYAEDNSWAKRQVRTAVSFQPESLFWGLASGGLNFQALHHIIPAVSASHLGDMYPRFCEVCKKHNVPVKEVSGICEFFSGFLSWVNALSQDDSVAVVAESNKAK